MNDIKELQAVMRDLYGEESKHVETVPPEETFQGQTVWEGEVEIRFTFDISCAIQPVVACRLIKDLLSGCHCNLRVAPDPSQPPVL